MIDRVLPPGTVEVSQSCSWIRLSIHPRLVFLDYGTQAFDLRRLSTPARPNVWGDGREIAP